MALHRLQKVDEQDHVGKSISDELAETNNVLTNDQKSKSKFVRRRTMRDKMESDGIMQKHVERYLRKELREAGACWNLPFVIGLFGFFIGAVTAHFRTEELVAADKAVVFDILENANFAFAGPVPFQNGRMGFKTFQDVNTFADFWSWLNLGLVPVFFPEGWDSSEPRANTAALCNSFKSALASFGGYTDELLNGTNDQEGIFGSLGTSCPEQDAPKRPSQFFGSHNATYLWYNRIVGGVRMRQEYRDSVACPGEAFRGYLFSGQCVPNNDYSLPPDLWVSLWTNGDYTKHPNAPPVYLLQGSTQADLRTQLRELENKAWFSPYTAKVEILFNTYNAHRHSFTATFVFLFQNNAGHYHKVVEPITLWLDQYEFWYQYVCDICWIMLVFKMLFEEVHDVSKHCRQLGVKAGMVKYMNWSNLVDWINVIYAFVIVILWFTYIHKLAQFNETLETADVNVLGSWPTEEERENFFQESFEIVMHTQRLRMTLAFYPFVMVSAFMKQFSSQPRLAVVTTTLYNATTDLLHFGVVWFTIFMLWTISGMFLFGQEVTDFANFGRALINTFRMLHGDFDWDILNRVGRAEGMLWFWSYNLIVNLTMTNMLLAIIMDTYAEVKGAIGNAETLWSQVEEIVNRRRSIASGKELPLNTVLKALDPTDVDSEDDAEGGDDMLTIEKFCEKVQGLGEEQAFQILKDAQTDIEDDKRGGGTSIAVTNNRILEMSQKLDEIKLTLDHGNRILEKLE